MGRGEGREGAPLPGETEEERENEERRDVACWGGPTRLSGVGARRHHNYHHRRSNKITIIIIIIIVVVIGVLGVDAAWCALADDASVPC